MTRTLTTEVGALIEIVLIVFAGTLVGSIGGIFVADKLSSYRIEQLEKKAAKLNELVKRMP